MRLPPPSPAHLLKLLGFVLVGPLEEVQQDDVTEDGPLEEEAGRIQWGCPARGGAGWQEAAVGTIALRQTAGQGPEGVLQRHLTDVSTWKNVQGLGRMSSSPESPAPGSDPRPKCRERT